VKRISAEEAASLVEPGMWIDMGGVNAQSEVFDRALAARAVDEGSFVFSSGRWRSSRPIPKASTSNPTIGISAVTTA
jgi:hypothetical protein